MPRIKRGTTTRKKHKRLLKKTKGYANKRGRLIKQAKEARLHALKHAARGRKIKKRDYRSLWIVRINSGLKLNGDYSYSTFIKQLKAKKIKLNRKTLAFLATEAPQVFKEIVKLVMSK